jgi:hypothetical protein
VLSLAAACAPAEEDDVASPPAAFVAASTGSGLTGRYFASQDLTGLVGTRVDASVHFDWMYGAPYAALSPDLFSVRWTGKVAARFSEAYTFFTRSDDGVRLWVDGKLVVNNWTDHAETENFGTVTLTAGKPVDLVMEFYEIGGRALSTLSWSSRSQPKQVVPTTQLFPESAAAEEEPRPLPPSVSYGTRQVSVPAIANWVNSGLYLRAGQSVTLSAFGSWVADRKPELGPTGPEGRDPSRTERGCTIGSLTARLGLGYEDPAIFCVGSGSTITAPKDGILYLGAIIDTDLGDAYEVRHDNSGTLSVVVSSAGSTVPSVQAAQIAGYDFTRVLSGWIELWSRHFIVTVPTSIARADRATAAASLDFLDRAYDRHAEVRGTVPFRGQRIRVLADEVLVPRGWLMLAGNPIRTVPGAFAGAPGHDHILRSSDPAYGVWGIVHELGHDFAHARGPWWYQVGTLEGWPNVFTVHTLRALERPDPICGHDATCPTARFCARRAAYMAEGTYQQFTEDTDLYLCFLLEQEERYGSALYPAFFRRLNAMSGAEVGNHWGFIRDQFNAITGVDTTPSFEEWKLPLP